MRRTPRLAATLTAGLVTAALAATGAPCHRRRRPTRRTACCGRTPQDTWRSMAAMADPAPAWCRTTSAATSMPHDRAEVHVTDQHRRLHVERGRGSRHRNHLGRRGARADRADLDDARRAREARAVGHVLQLVRPGDRREADDVAC